MSLNKDEIIDLFSDEHLKKQSIDDYISLLQQSSGNFLTHLVQNGVKDFTAKDQFGFRFYNLEENKFYSGVVDLLKTRYLKSSLNLTFGDDFDVNSIDSLIESNKSGLLVDPFLKLSALETLSQSTLTPSTCHVPIEGFNIFK